MVAPIFFATALSRSGWMAQSAVATRLSSRFADVSTEGRPGCRRLGREENVLFGSREILCEALLYASLGESEETLLVWPSDLRSQ